jgi:flavin-dependent dehydrogenase
MYDAIIVGARCAGSITALCLARRGARVLVLDRTTFPSDSLSTANYDRGAATRFRALGVGDAIAATGAPLLPHIRIADVDHGIGFTGTYLLDDGAEQGRCVRRLALDAILVDAARAAGVEVRERVTATGLMWENGRITGVTIRADSSRSIAERARFVLGADGRYSPVARWVQAPYTRFDAADCAGYFAWFGGVAGPRDTIELLRNAHRDIILFPSNDGLTCVLVAIPQAQFPTYRTDAARRFMADIQDFPGLAERFATAERVSPVAGAGDLTSHARVAGGPGWALVGDASLHTHPVTGRGIGLAVSNAERLAAAVSATLAGTEEEVAAITGYERDRDMAGIPLYEQALAVAALTGNPLPAPVAALWSALGQQPEAAERFVSGQIVGEGAIAAVIARARERDGAAAIQHHTPGSSTTRSSSEQGQKG